MSPLVLELEAILNELLAENQRLLKHLLLHQAAMKQFDTRAMDAAGRHQEASRSRIAGLDMRRRVVTSRISREHGARTDLTIAQIAAIHVERGEALLRQRAALKDLIQQVSDRVQVTGKLAGAVLGHLNTVVRLLAGAVEKAGLYTKQGVPHVAARIGILEAVA